MPTSPRETVLYRYKYDPLDCLVDCAPYEGAGIRRFYCKSRLATEIQGAMQTSVFQHDDQLLAQQRCDGVKVDTTLLATDQQRSVLNALDATQPRPLAYTPYGHRPPENGLLSLLGFNGERPDPVTGHYLLGNGYRAFNPVLMRFNSPDSWSPFGEGGLNAYGYCAGDPVSRVDPTGHMFKGFKNPFKTPSMSASQAKAPKKSILLPGSLGPSNGAGTMTELPNGKPMQVVSGSDGMERVKPRVTDQQQSGPPLPPRNVPRLPPPRPVTKPDPRPPRGFFIKDGYAWINLPYENDHAFVASVPLSHESVINLRREGVHIHSDLLSTDIGKSRVNYGFEPDLNDPNSIRRNL